MGGKQRAPVNKHGKNDIFHALSFFAGRDDNSSRVS
jgi:hypothetical protein